MMRAVDRYHGSYMLSVELLPIGLRFVLSNHVIINLHKQTIII